MNADPAKQKAYYQKLVAAYPDDERAHNLLAELCFHAQKSGAEAGGDVEKLKTPS